jgi:hypothetical protein
VCRGHGHAIELIEDLDLIVGSCDRLTAMLREDMNAEKWRHELVGD